MRRDAYQARVAAHLCAYTHRCTRKPVGAFCAFHRRKSRKYNRACLKRSYDAKKLAGDCVYRGCKLRQEPDCILCPGHHQSEKERQSKPEVRAGKNRSSAKTRATWVADKKCGACGAEPLLTEYLGEKCREKIRARANARYRAKAKREGRTVRVQRCRLCQGDDHRADRCRGLPALPPLSIDDFVYSRQSDACEESA